MAPGTRTAITVSYVLTARLMDIYVDIKFRSERVGEACALAARIKGSLVIQISSV